MVSSGSWYTPVSCVASAGSIASATAIGMDTFCGGQISIPNGSSITSLTFYVSDQQDGTYQALYDASNVAVTMTVAADRAYVLPVAVNSAISVKIVANAAGTINFVGKTL